MSSTKRTIAELRQHSIEGEFEFMKGRLESELKWLESGIADIRREMDRGSMNEARNLVAKAGDVADYVGKLRSAHERLELLKDITATQEAAK